MNNKLLQWIRANLLGIFGCMYLPKKDAKNNLILCDISFLVIYTVVAITTVVSSQLLSVIVIYLV